MNFTNSTLRELANYQPNFQVPGGSFPAAKLQKKLFSLFPDIQKLFKYMSITSLAYRFFSE